MLRLKSPPSKPEIQGFREKGETNWNWYQKLYSATLSLILICDLALVSFAYTL